MIWRLNPEEIPVSSLNSSPLAASGLPLGTEKPQFPLSLPVLVSLGDVPVPGFVPTG